MSRPPTRLREFFPSCRRTPGTKIAPSTWRRTLCGSHSTVTPELPEGPLELNRDYPGHDIAPCGVHGCAMTANATAQDCKALCSGGACVGYVFAASACAAGGAAVCWTKSSMPEASGVEGQCRTSQRVGKPASNGTDLATKWARALGAGAGSDRVVGYFGLRSLRVGRAAESATTRPLLNGNATFFAGWLDQSWWPDGQYTAPTDEALASDIAAVSMFGLNMVRLHMKVNPERWYYHADTRGVAVFQDMPQLFVKAAAAGPAWLSPAVQLSSWAAEQLSSWKCLFLI